MKRNLWTFVMFETCPDTILFFKRKKHANYYSCYSSFVGLGQKKSHNNILKWKEFIRFSSVITIQKLGTSIQEMKFLDFLKKYFQNFATFWVFI